MLFWWLCDRCISGKSVTDVMQVTLIKTSRFKTTRQRDHSS